MEPGPSSGPIMSLLDLPETPVLDGIAAALGCGAARAAARLAHPRLCAAVDRTLASLAVGGGYRCRRRGKFPPAQMANLTARFPALERSCPAPPPGGRPSPWSRGAAPWWAAPSGSPTPPGGAACGDWAWQAWMEGAACGASALAASLGSLPPGAWRGVKRIEFCMHGCMHAMGGCRMPELLLLVQQLARLCPTLEEVEGAIDEVWPPQDKLAALAPAARSLRRINIAENPYSELMAEHTPRSAQMLAAFTNVRELTASLASGGDAALLAGALPALAALSRLDLCLSRDSGGHRLEEGVVFWPLPLELAPLLLSAGSSLVDLRLRVHLDGAPASFKAGAAALGITRLEFSSWSAGNGVRGDDGGTGGVLAGLLASAAPTLRSLDLSKQPLRTPLDRLSGPLPALTELLLAGGKREPVWRRRGEDSSLAGVAPRLRALSVPASECGGIELPSAAGCEELTELTVRDVSLIQGSCGRARLPRGGPFPKMGYESDWGREYHDDMLRTFWSASLLDWTSPFLPTLREFEYTCDYPLLLHVALPMLASAAGPTLRRLSLASCVLLWGGAQGAAAGRCFPQFEALEALRLQLLISEGVNWGDLASLEGLVGPLLAPGARGAAPCWAPPALREAVFEVPAGCMAGDVATCCARLAAAAGARPMLRFGTFDKPDDFEDD
ncbi:MAG: hypothetical protein J3K34DRAFT_477943 [Monoraphidium minutum]|nr:MAG: hypothetical protein J3K34DRAFT_477943 [Monoraphidium minutum]